MSDRWWRLHLLALGWSAVLLGSAATIWLYTYFPLDRYNVTGNGAVRLDRRTGEVRIVDHGEPGGRILMQAADSTPPPRGRLIWDITWPPATATPTVMRRGNVIDDAGILGTARP